jgi:hypothetical protein
MARLERTAAELGLAVVHEPGRSHGSARGRLTAASDARDDGAAALLR